jgi:ATP-dependent RNA helicase DDX5/DBP2
MGAEVAQSAEKAKLKEEKAQRKAARAKLREEKAQRKAERAKARQTKAESKAIKAKLGSSSDSKPRKEAGSPFASPTAEDTSSRKRKRGNSDAIDQRAQEPADEVNAKKKKKRADPNRKARRQQTREYLLNREGVAAAAAHAVEQVPLTEEQQGQLEQRTQKFRTEHDIRVTDLTETSACASSAYSIPPPMFSFSDTPFCKPIRTALDDAGYTDPTATQAQAWPICLQGRDVISVAKTGSGKTCGFLLPAFHLLEKIRYEVTEKSKQGLPKILVLAPTRELACQIHGESVKFGRSVGIKSVCLFGGAPRRAQIGELRSKKPEVIIATPGRLMDLLELKCTSLSEVRFLVLDEADRMLDMGFEPQIRAVVSQLPPTAKDAVQATAAERSTGSGSDDNGTHVRQTMFFTATWPEEVRGGASHHASYQAPHQGCFGSALSLLSLALSLALSPLLSLALSLPPHHPPPHPVLLLLLPSPSLSSLRITETPSPHAYALPSHPLPAGARNRNGVPH